MNKQLLAFLVMAISYVFVFVVGVYVMMFGWGLTPKSWVIIIGGQLLLLMIMFLVISVTSVLAKD